MHSKTFINRFSFILSVITASAFICIGLVFTLNGENSRAYLPLILLCASMLFTCVCAILSLHYPIRILRLLAIFYYFSGSAIVLLLPDSTMIVLLAFSICIISGSLSFGRRFSLIGAIASIVTLVAMYVFTTEQVIAPQSYETMLSQSLLLAVLAYFCWHSLSMADRYYQRFGKQLDNLSTRVEAYDKQLKNEDHKELLMLYKFADAGRKSVAVLHNLANHLTLMALEDKSDKRSFGDVNTLIAQAYDSLKTTTTSRFEVFQLLSEETIPALRSIADEHNVTIECIQEGSNTPTDITGDPCQLGLVVTILVHNAIEAYRHTRKSKRLVTLRIDHDASVCRITVDDYGPGIPASMRSHLFESPLSSADECHGVGLFTAREIIVHHFKGSLTLDSRRNVTRFVIHLPISKEKQQPLRQA